MERLTKITVDDVIRAGACEEGVYKFINRLYPNIAASVDVIEILTLLRPHEKLYVVSAARLDGYGDGNGYGYGYGYGDGDGSGSGSGYGKY